MRKEYFLKFAFKFIWTENIKSRISITLIFYSRKVTLTKDIFFFFDIINNRETKFLTVALEFTIKVLPLNKNISTYLVRNIKTVN